MQLVLFRHINWVLESFTTALSEPYKGNFSLEYLEWLKESFLCQVLATIIGASPCITGVWSLLFWTDAFAFTSRPDCAGADNSIRILP